ncbi:SDR family NAD(P)-dependent oxidoreductase [Nocardia sp. NPDC057353]|uniref:SDR family NAD(P)-dependent oxidoreductase n=1 Tax=Nocardia sp. NPDC057353 TaxID=3346104 RepID=UPI0036398246
MTGREPAGRAVVIGGASGIGAAIVRALAAAGAPVTVADRDVAAARTLAAELGAEPAALDVTDEDSVAALFESVPGPVDFVVNTAGVSVLGLLTELPADKWRRVLDVCLTGAFLTIKHAAPRLAAGGSIAVLSSLNARQPAIGMGAYCSAKAGLGMLVEVAALELAPRGIRVNAIAPGLVRTPLTAASLELPGVEADYLANTPLGRAGTPEEIADAALYLRRAGWLTGETLDLNGGAHLLRYPDVHGHIRRATAPAAGKEPTWTR